MSFSSFKIRPWPGLLQVGNRLLLLLWEKNKKNNQHATSVPAPPVCVRDANHVFYSMFVGIYTTGDEKLCKTFFKPFVRGQIIFLDGRILGRGPLFAHRFIYTQQETIVIYHKRRLNSRMFLFLFHYFLLNYYLDFANKKMTPLRSDMK